MRSRMKNLARLSILALIASTARSYNVNEIVKSNSDRATFLEAIDVAGVTKQKHIQKWIKNWEKYWNHVQKEADKDENLAEKELEHADRVADAQAVLAREVVQQMENVARVVAKQESFESSLMEKEARVAAKSQAQSENSAEKIADAEAKVELAAEKMAEKEMKQESKAGRNEAKQSFIEAKEQRKLDRETEKSQLVQQKSQKLEDSVAEKEAIIEMKEEIHEENQARKESNADSKAKRAKKMMRVKFAKQLRKEAGFPGVMSYTGCVPDNSIVNFEHSRTSPSYDGVGVFESMGVVTVNAPEECRGLWYVMVGHMAEIGGIESVDSIHSANAVKNKFNSYNWHRLAPYNSQWGLSQVELNVKIDSSSDPTGYKYYYCCQGEDEVEEWLGSQGLTEPAEDCSAADGSFVQWSSNSDIDFAFRKKRKRREVVDESEIPASYGTLTVNVMGGDWGNVDNAYFVARGNPFSQITSLVAKLDNNGALTDCNVVNQGNDVWKVELPSSTSSIGMGIVPEVSSFRLLAKIGGVTNMGNYVSWYWCEGV